MPKVKALLLFLMEIRELILSSVWMTRATPCCFYSSMLPLPSRTHPMAEAQYFCAFWTLYDLPPDLTCHVLSPSPLLLSLLLLRSFSLTRAYYSCSGPRTFKLALLLAGDSSPMCHPSSLRHFFWVQHSIPIPS